MPTSPRKFILKHIIDPILRNNNRLGTHPDFIITNAKLITQDDANDIVNQFKLAVKFLNEKKATSDVTKIAEQLSASIPRHEQRVFLLTSTTSLTPNDVVIEYAVLKKLFSDLKEKYIAEGDIYSGTIYDVLKETLLDIGTSTRPLRSGETNQC